MLAKTSSRLQKFRYYVLVPELSLGFVLGKITGLQQTRMNNNSVMKNHMLVHINIVFLQFEIILLNRGSSDLSDNEAE